MSKISVKEAMAQLDPTNDDHWTTEGAPRLDVIKEIVGRPVSRSELMKVSKVFCRKHNNLDTLPPVDEKVETTDSETQEGKKGETEAEANTTTEAPETETSNAGESTKSALEALHERADKARVALTCAQDEYDSIMREIDVLNVELEENEMSGTEVFQAYLKSQNEMRQKQADAIKDIQATMKGLNVPGGAF